MRIPRKKKKRMKKGEGLLYKDTWYAIVNVTRYSIHGVDLWRKVFKKVEGPVVESSRPVVLNLSNYGKG